MSWSSADTTVAAVDSAGLVTAIGGGATTVAATAGEVPGTAVVTVMQSAGSVVVSPAVDTVALGDTLRLGAEAFDENGHRVEGAGFRWSSSDASVATVDASGLVMGVADGTTTIAAAAGDASGTSEITVENPDRTALVALYNAADGPNWVNSKKWLTEAPLGEWYGVETDESGRVVRLDLSGRWDSDAREYKRHGLSGSIPAQLGSLADLQSLDLSVNDIGGAIPSKFGDLANLRLLDLSRNGLTDSIPPELGSLTSLEYLEFGSNGLTGAIPVELGNLANLRSLGLGQNGLTGPIPAELASLANLESLWLAGNALTGTIPAVLGNLANLESLSLSFNAFKGPIPQSFLQLDRLRRFYIGNNVNLCVPGSSAFVAWLRRIEDRDEDSESVFCNAADVAALKSLYESTGGPAWTNSAGWLGNAALAKWYGVEADSLGRLVTLDLTGNGLAGRLPASLGELAHMTELRIADNAELSGRLPLSLAHLSLRALGYAGTDLCAPADASFRAWLGGIESHEGTGVECAPLSDRDILVALYEATDGPNWLNSGNWLTDAPLRQWHGVYTTAGRVVGLTLYFNRLTGPIPPELGGLSRLKGLRLFSNALTGSIPPELGSLSELTNLDLHFNRLSGPIPPELGNLSKLTSLELDLNRQLSGSIPRELGSLSELQSLNLSRTGLSGPIPSELGNLSSLQSLNLSQTGLSGPIPQELGNLSSLTELEVESSGLTGSIPREIGNLSSLRRLRLYDNSLSGPIPSEIGELSRLTEIHLGLNGLSGPIPPELGNLSELTEVNLQDNRLTGSWPPELGRLASLRVLHLAQNSGLSGSLPFNLTALRALEVLMLAGTDLCAPADASFLEWLAGIENGRVRPCDREDAAMAYLTQTVQSREFPVPLVAAEAALLRVFVTAQRTTSQGIPPVRARFYLDGAETHFVDIPGQSRTRFRPKSTRGRFRSRPT